MNTKSEAREALLKRQALGFENGEELQGIRVSDISSLAKLVHAVLGQLKLESSQCVF
jgi:hypothetical protein